MGAVVALNIERSLRIEIDFRSFRHQIFAWALGPAIDESNESNQVYSLLRYMRHFEDIFLPSTD